MRPILLLPAVLFSALLAAQPAIEWERALGGSLFEYFGDVVPAGSGYLVAGSSQSLDGDLTANNGLDDIWITMLDTPGVIRWQKSFGGTQQEYPGAIIPLSDGGCIIAGGTRSNDGDISFNRGQYDCWVIRLDSAGTLLWERTYGGPGNEFFYSILQASDGGFIIAGYTDSQTGDISFSHGGAEMWLVKINQFGTLQWEKTFGGSSADICFSMSRAGGGKLALTGYTYSLNGDVTVNKGQSDFWVVMADEDGSLLWQKTYGGSLLDWAQEVSPTSDGGLLVTGRTNSSDGDISFLWGDYDTWLLKLDSTGALEWERVYGGPGSDFGRAVLEIEPGRYILGSTTNSFDSAGVSDIWVMELDILGNPVWQKFLGGSGYDGLGKIRLDEDGGLVLGCGTGSMDGDVTNNHGGNDIWIARLESIVSTGVSELFQSGGFYFFPNPAETIIHINLPPDSKCTLVSLSNLTGNEMLVSPLPAGEQEARIDVSSLSPGFYLIRLDTGSEVLTSKVVIAK